MTWNYRIILHADEPSGPWYGLHEVYYHANGEPDGWTENPVRFACEDYESPAGIVGSLEMAIADAKKLPILVECDGKLC